MVRARRIGIAGLLVILLAVPAVQDQAWSGKLLYSYLDDQGNLVATDRPEEIPERYRNRVKITEKVASREDASPGALMLAMPSSAEELLVGILDRTPAQIIPGLTAYQSVMLVAGFSSILLMYALGRFSRGAFLPLLMPWAIGFLLLGTLYLMFVSDLSDKVALRSAGKSSGSLVQRFRAQSKDLAEKKEQRMKRFDQGQE